MNPDAGGLPAQVALMFILGAFLAVSAALAARRPARRRIGRHHVHGCRSRPGSRAVGYDTMRIRPRTGELTNAGRPERADDEIAMRLVA